MQTAQLIDFAAVLNARRAAAQIATREQANLARIEAKVDSLIEHLETVASRTVSPAGAEIVAAIVHAEEAATAAANASRYSPAYCDPENEVKGSKYDATERLYGADLAKRIRQDIKEAQKAGRIAKGFKISVRTDTYAGGYSIDVRVTAVPEGFNYYTPERASWEKQFGRNTRRDMPSVGERYGRDACLSLEWVALRDALQSIHGAYNRDNSDSMVDYFDRRYYGDVSIDWQVLNEITARQVAESAGDYWAENCAD
jgi:hypothetical protein